MKSFAEIPWQSDQKIVIGIDLGTTQSAVSYSYLYPGGPQTIQRVTTWPGQSRQQGETKIPSIVYSDSNGKAVAFGAEALLPQTRIKAEDESWQLAEHFKLHLHPSTMRNRDKITAAPLPKGKRIVEIYADVFGYLIKHTEEFFKVHELDGENLWKTLWPKADVIIAHPNGWGTHEQSVLREAAVAAGLVPPPSAKERIHFVSEAEASVHFVMFHSDMEARIKPGSYLLICDAGGSTVDTTLYVVKNVTPNLDLEEKQASACVQAGAIFVNKAAEAYFRALFQKAEFDAEDVTEYTQQAVESFESSGKKAFGNPDDEVMIEVGGHKFNERSLGIRRGMMSMPGREIEKFFEGCVTQILDSVTSQMQGHPVKCLLLVGGFGESPYLRQKLKDGPCAGGIDLTLANDSTAKAVSDGAIIWFAKKAVKARATRYAYGVHNMVPYNPQDPRHQNRPVHTDREGSFIWGVWSEIVPRNQVFEDGYEKEKVYYRTFITPTPNLNLSSEIYVWTKPEPAPYYIFDKYQNLVDGFSKACDINANLSALSGKLRQNVTMSGSYWSLRYGIGFTFGSTELRAVTSWNEDGRDCKAEAVLIPHQFI